MFGLVSIRLLSIMQIWNWLADYAMLGSSIHSMKVFSNPRWEDFEYDYLNDNPMGWIGDGWTENEKYKKINVDYLDDDQIDFPTPVAQNGTE